eukprot:7682696-Pyramimonas_sp.AAC.1
MPRGVRAPQPPRPQKRYPNRPLYMIRLSSTWNRTLRPCWAASCPETSILPLRNTVRSLQRVCVSGRQRHTHVGGGVDEGQGEGDAVAGLHWGVRHRHHAALRTRQR